MPSSAELWNDIAIHVEISDEVSMVVSDEVPKQLSDEVSKELSDNPRSFVMNDHEECRASEYHEQKGPVPSTATATTINYLLTFRV